MGYQAIEVRKLTPTIGAEVFGVNIGQGLSNRQFNEIHDALMENLVIFFRDQKMTPEQHKDFGLHFGKLHIHPNAPQLLSGNPEILVIKADEKSKRVAGEETLGRVVRPGAADGFNPLYAGGPGKRWRRHDVRQYVCRL